MDDEVPSWPRTIALLDWTHLIEDLLDNLGVSFEQFRSENASGWMYGYTEALRLAGCSAVHFFVSTRVKEITHARHERTGAPICVLPAPRIYRSIRRRVLNPYAASVEEAVGLVSRWSRPFFWGIKELAPFFATPLTMLARELRAHHCEVILCQEYEHPRFDECVVLGRLLNLPVFATFQGGDTALTRLEQPFRRLSVNICAGLIVGAQREIERIRQRYRVPCAKIARIFNPIQLSDWYPDDRVGARAELGIPLTARVVAWHGRVQEQIKGLDVLLDAWWRTCRRAQEKELFLLLVGTGQDAGQVRKRISDLGLQKHVIWIDKFILNRSILRRYLSAADVYTLTSRREGFPIAPIEAMACGLPVIAVEVSGIADILEGGQDSGGIVVPQGDVDALATEFLGILADDTNRELFGARARRRVLSCFGLDAVGAQIRDFLATRTASPISQVSTF